MADVVNEELKSTIREKYGEAAKRVPQGQAADPDPACCGEVTDCCQADPVTSNLYDDAEKASVPAAAVKASLGCGNPTALAELRAGEVVLDLGSGGGIDVLLSAKRVGTSGKVYGLDMTDEMLELARRNQVAAGVQNVEFLRGEIEAIPLPESSVDVVISNCVINLSGDKDRVLSEAFRVLKPGGRFAVSDVVVTGDLPAVIRCSMELWVGCVAGALDVSEYIDKLSATGFTNISVEPTREYRLTDAHEVLTSQGIDVESLQAQVQGRILSAFIRATKPGD